MQKRHEQINYENFAQITFLVPMCTVPKLPSHAAKPAKKQWPMGTPLDLIVEHQTSIYMIDIYIYSFLLSARIVNPSVE